MTSDMGAVKEGCLVANALDIVHFEGGIDSTKLRLENGLPERVPKHPGKIFIAIYLFLIGET